MFYFSAKVGASCATITQLCTALANSECDATTKMCKCKMGYYGATDATTCTQGNSHALAMFAVLNFASCAAIPDFSSALT